jgi:hypothetical protein
MIFTPRVATTSITSDYVTAIVSDVTGQYPSNPTGYKPDGTGDVTWPSQNQVYKCLLAGYFNADNTYTWISVNNGTWANTTWTINIDQPGKVLAVFLIEEFIVSASPFAGKTPQQIYDTYSPSLPSSSNPWSLETGIVTIPEVQTCLQTKRKDYCVSLINEETPHGSYVTLQRYFDAYVYAIQLARYLDAVTLLDKMTELCNCQDCNC